MSAVSASRDRAGVGHPEADLSLSLLRPTPGSGPVSSTYTTDLKAPFWDCHMFYSQSPRI